MLAAPPAPVGAALEDGADDLRIRIDAAGAGAGGGLCARPRFDYAARVLPRGILLEHAGQAAPAEHVLQAVDDGVDCGAIAVVLCRIFPERAQVLRADRGNDGVVAEVPQDLELSETGIGLRVVLVGAVGARGRILAESVVVPRHPISAAIAAPRVLLQLDLRAVALLLARRGIGRQREDARVLEVAAPGHPLVTVDRV